MLFLILTPLIFVITLVLPILSFLRATAAAKRLEELDARLQRMEDRVDRLARSAAQAAPDVRPAPSSAPQRSVAPVPAPPPVSIPTPVLPAAPTLALPAPVEQTTSPDLESEIGTRLMLVVGVVILVLGVAFFLKYAFDNAWISPTTRVVSGSAAGIAAWLVGLQFSKRGYPLYGHMIAAGGLAMIYLSAYSAYALYGLVPAAAAFGWMAATSAVTAVTADREVSPGLALMAITLGYAAPFLVASHADHHIVLFVYDASLVGATFVLARRHEWPLVTLISFLLAWMAFSSWATGFYRPAMFVSS